MSETRVIITAAGESSRFGGPKHLTDLEGETILGRAVRLFREHATDVVVSVRDEPRYKIEVERHGGTWFVPTITELNRECDMYVNCRHLWRPTGRTVIAYGDTWYSEDAVRTIMTHTKREWHLFARFAGSLRTGKGWPEVWAHSFFPEHHADEDRAIAAALGDAAAPRATIYEMYRHLFGAEKAFDWKQRDLGQMTHISDWTEDFDYPRDIAEWSARRDVARSWGAL